MTIITALVLMILLAGVLFSAVEYYANKNHKKPELTKDPKSSVERTSYCTDGITN